MANDTSLRGKCPAPFFDESKFPSNSGYVKGRICATLPGGADITCCLPCPAADWLYPSDFYAMTRIPGFIALASICVSAFLLLAFIVLPAEVTKRHYLNTCLLVSVIVLELGLAVPVLVKPEQCANSITPSDQSNNWTCAFSGGFIVVGGCAASMWILMRVLSMHLQICWDVVPKRTFFWSSQLAAWGVTAALTAICLSITGVSFRFGDYCHVNDYKGLQTLWGPLLGIAGLSLFLQISTFIYCLKVYLHHSFDDRPVSGNSRSTSAPSSSRAQTVRVVYRRVNRVLSLQWRSLIIAATVTVDVVYLAVVFVVLNARLDAVVKDVPKVLPWVFCIVLSKGADKEKCLPKAEPLRPRGAILIATLVLLSIVGMQLFVLIVMKGMFTGWWTAISTWRLPTIAWRRKSESSFVNLDSAEDASISRSTNPAVEKKIEMIKVTSPSTTVTEASPQTTFTSPTDTKSPGSFKSPASFAISTPMSNTLVEQTDSSVFAEMDLESGLTQARQEQARLAREQAFFLRPGNYNSSILPVKDPVPYRDVPKQTEALAQTEEDLDTGTVPYLARNQSLERQYRPSYHSFSSPRPPSSARTASHVEWDRSSTLGRPMTAESFHSGLGVAMRPLLDERERSRSRSRRRDTHDLLIGPE